MELQNSRYGSSNIGVFSVTFSDFHEVPTCDEIMGKWSQAEMKAEMYSIISQAIVF